MTFTCSPKLSLSRSMWTWPEWRMSPWHNLVTDTVQKESGLLTGIGTPYGTWQVRPCSSHFISTRFRSYFQEPYLQLSSLPTSFLYLNIPFTVITFNFMAHQNYWQAARTPGSISWTTGKLPSESLTTSITWSYTEVLTWRMECSTELGWVITELSLFSPQQFRKSPNIQPAPRFLL